MIQEENAPRELDDDEGEPFHIKHYNKMENLLNDDELWELWGMNNENNLNFSQSNGIIACLLKVIRLFYFKRMNVPNGFITFEEEDMGKDWYEKKERKEEEKLTGRVELHLQNFE